MSSLNTFSTPEKTMSKSGSVESSDESHDPNNDANAMLSIFNRPQMDWKQAVRNSCVTRKRICCRMGDIMDDNAEQYSVADPEVWEDWSRMEAIVEHLQEMHRPDTTTSSSSLYSLLGTTYSAIRFVVYDAPTYLTKQILPKSDYDTDYHVSPIRSPSMQSPPSRKNPDDYVYVAWDICDEAIELLRSNVRSVGEEPTIVPATKFLAWNKSRMESLADPVATWLTSLPESHFMALSTALHLPQFTDESSGEIFLYISSNAAPTANSMEAHATVYKLDRAIGKIDQRINEYQEKAETALRNARSTRSVASLRLHKSYTNRLQQARQEMLNLTSVREHVVERLGQRDTVEVLEAAVESLGNLRLETEGVESVMDDLAEEMHATQEVHESLTANNIDVDEDELLAELANLTLADVAEETANSPGNSGGAPPKERTNDEESEANESGDKAEKVQHVAVALS